MAKGQKRSSREAKKPKKDKKAPPVLASFGKGLPGSTVGIPKKR